MLSQGNHADDPVAVHHFAPGIGKDHAVGIAIQSHAQIGVIFADQSAHCFGVDSSA